jgi:iron complex transport system substrate-binding protein
MKPTIPLLALILAGCTQPAAQGGGGIVSTNPCADAMLVELVPANRIAAISHYSVQADASSMPLSVARRFATTAGTAEEVIGLHPDLVVTSSFTPPATLAAYRRVGLKVLTLDSPTTIAASEAQIRTLAAALGAQGQGEAMVARIEKAASEATPCLPLPVGEGRGPSRSDGKGEGRAMTSATNSLDPHPPAASRLLPASGQSFPRNGLNSTGCCLPDAPKGRGNTCPSALLFIAGDLANGTGTLLDELLTRAGFRNAAADYGLHFTGGLPIETIAAHPPRVIFAPDASRTAVLRTRVLARTGAIVTEASFPRRLVNCGGPAIVPALQRLSEVRRSLGS